MLKRIVSSLTLSLLGIIFTLIILETIARLILPTSDAPDIIFDQQLGNTFVPNQKGTYIKGKNAEIKALYNINNTGWNSPYEYNLTKNSKTYRIAVIGDSYIEALQVNYDKSYPYLIPSMIKSHLIVKKNIEVYTFGHSGANLVHYSHILEFVSQNYNPDLVIINLVDNDFLESLYGYSRKDNWSFNWVDSKFIEKPPQSVSNLVFKRIIRNSALVRFLTINLDIVNTLPLFNKLFYAETRTHSISNIPPTDALEQIVDFTFQRYLALSQLYSFKLLLILDTDRKAIYNNEDPTKSEENYSFNIAKRYAQKFNIPLIDLSLTFKKSWQEKEERFDWISDDHWNLLGHELVAKEVSDWVTAFLSDNR